MVNTAGQTVTACDGAQVERTSIGRRTGRNRHHPYLSTQALLFSNRKSSLMLCSRQRWPQTKVFHGKIADAGTPNNFLSGV
jgi:hypothetical protein